MKKLLFSIIIFMIAFSLKANPVLAEANVAGSSAQLKGTESVSDTDYRVVKLRAYLAKNKSPLTDYAQDFVTFADLYRLDWRLVAAISGVESTFGKRIPADSYNAYGWANGEYQFTSWENSIQIVSKTLREKYGNHPWRISWSSIGISSWTSNRE